MCKFLTMQHTRLVLIAMLSALFFATVSTTAQNLQWFANDHFQLSEVSEDALLVTYQKQPWEAFTLYVGEADFSEKAILSFSVKTDARADLRIDVMDASGSQATVRTTEIKLDGEKEFTEVNYDFGQLAQKIDLSKISHFHFYVNPGVKTTGELLIKNIQLPTEVKIQDKTEVIAFPNPTIDILKIKTIGQSFDELIIYDAQGREVARKAIHSTNYYEFRLDQLPAGFYQFQLNQNAELIAVDPLIIE